MRLLERGQEIDAACPGRLAAEPTQQKFDRLGTSLYMLEQLRRHVVELQTPHGIVDVSPEAPSDAADLVHQ